MLICWTGKLQVSGGSALRLIKCIVSYWAAFIEHLVFVSELSFYIISENYENFCSHTIDEIPAVFSNSGR